MVPRHSRRCNERPRKASSFREGGGGTKAAMGARRKKEPSMRTARLVLSILVLAAGCVSAPEAADETSAALASGTLVVNECATGTSGWIELYNASAVAV